MSLFLIQVGKIGYMSTLAKTYGCLNQYENDYICITAWCNFVTWLPFWSASVSAGQSTRREAHPCHWKRWWWQSNIDHLGKRPQPPGDQEWKWT